jgi:hypothetical protein
LLDRLNKLLLLPSSFFLLLLSSTIFQLAAVRKDKAKRDSEFEQALADLQLQLEQQKLERQEQTQRQLDKELGQQQEDIAERGTHNGDDDDDEEEKGGGDDGEDDGSALSAASSLAASSSNRGRRSNGSSSSASGGSSSSKRGKSRPPLSGSAGTNGSGGGCGGGSGGGGGGGGNARHHHHQQSHHQTPQQQQQQQRDTFRSPSIDPISRMVAQLPERERTAHLASELVAAQDRAKAKDLALTALEQKHKLATSELEATKAKAAEHEKRLEALLNHQEGQEEGHGDNDGGRGVSGGGGSGGGGGSSSAEVAALRAALNTKDEQLESLRDELNEATEDAALLRTLNEMDQLTIGSLTTGGKPSSSSASPHMKTAEGTVGMRDDDGSGGGSKEEEGEDQGLVSSAGGNGGGAAGVLAKAAEAAASKAAAKARAEEGAKYEAAMAFEAEKSMALGVRANEEKRLRVSAEERAREVRQRLRRQEQELEKTSRLLQQERKQKQRRNNKGGRKDGEGQGGGVEEEEEEREGEEQEFSFWTREEQSLWNMDVGFSGSASPSSSSSGGGGMNVGDEDEDGEEGGGGDPLFFGGKTRTATPDSSFPITVGSAATVVASAVASAAAAGVKAVGSMFLDSSNHSGDHSGRRSANNNHSSGGGGGGNSAGPAESFMAAQAALLCSSNAGRHALGRRRSEKKRENNDDDGEEEEEWRQAAAAAAAQEDEVEATAWAEAGEVAGLGDAMVACEKGQLPCLAALEALAATTTAAATSKSRLGGHHHHHRHGSTAATAARALLAEVRRRKQTRRRQRRSEGAGSGPDDDNTALGVAGAVSMGEFVGVVSRLNAMGETRRQRRRQDQRTKTAAAGNHHTSDEGGEDFSDADDDDGEEEGLKDVACFELARWCAKVLRQKAIATIQQGKQLASQLPAALQEEELAAAAGAGPMGDQHHHHHRGQGHQTLARAFVEVALVRSLVVERQLGQGLASSSSSSSASGWGNKTRPGYCDLELETGGDDQAPGQRASLPGSRAPHLASMFPSSAAREHAKSGSGHNKSNGDGSGGDDGASAAPSNLTVLRFPLSQPLASKDDEPGGVLRGEVRLRADRGDDSFLGVFKVAVADLLPPLMASASSSEGVGDRGTNSSSSGGGIGAGGGDEGSGGGVAWVQRWCATELDQGGADLNMDNFAVNNNGGAGSSSGSKQTCLVLLRARVVTSEAMRLKAELASLSRRVKSLKAEMHTCFSPLSVKWSGPAVGSLKRALKEASSRLAGRDSTPLEWWRFDLTQGERCWWAGVGLLGLVCLVGLSVGLGPSHPMGRRARALGLLLQACLVWELCNYAGEASSGVQQALKASWLRVDPSLVLVGCTVGKIGVTAAIFHGVLVFFGADGGGALFGGSESANGGGGGYGDDNDPLTKLLWVWFFGILTGHLVFGRLAHDEALEFLRVDMETAREAIAEAEAQDQHLAMVEEEMEEQRREKRFLSADAATAKEGEHGAVAAEEVGAGGRSAARGEGALSGANDLGILDEEFGEGDDDGNGRGGSDNEFGGDAEVTEAFSESDGHVADMSSTVGAEESY